MAYSMGMKHTGIISIMLAVFIAGCATGPGFQSGECGQEYMVKLLPPTSDIFIFINVKEMEETDFFTQLLMLGLNEVEELSRFLDRCEIDIHEDVYSISMGLLHYQGQARNYSGAMVINLSYDNRLLTEWLHQEGYSIIEENDTKIRMYGMPEGKSPSNRLALLSDSLIFIGNEEALDYLSDPKAMKKSDTKRLVSIMQTVHTDAVGLGGITDFTRFLKASEGGNSASLLFSGVNAVAFSFDYNQEDVFIEVLMLVDDEEKKANIFTIFNLTSSAGNIGDDNPLVARILTNMEVSSEKNGVRLLFTIPVLTFVQAVSEYTKGQNQ